MNTSPVTVGDLTINAGKTLTINGQMVIWINGNTSISGTLTESAGNIISDTWIIPKGNFTINAGGTFTAIAANIRFDFAGTTNQIFTNNGTVTSPLRDLSFENTVSVTLAGSNPIVSNRVNLFSGTVINSNLLTIGNAAADVGVQRGGFGATVPAGSFDVTPDFNYGTHSIGLIYDYSTTPINAGMEFPATGIVDYFTMYNGPTVILTNDLMVANTLTWYGISPYKFTGTLDLGGKILTLSGAFTRTGSTGTLKGGSTSTIDLNGITAITLPAVTNGGLYDLIIENTAGVTLNGGITINNILYLYSGTLTNSVTNNITMSAGSLIDRYDGSSIAVTPVGTSYDVTYENNATINTGPEMQNNSVIRDLTLNGSDNVTMNVNATVNRDFIILGGNLNIGAFTLTLKGGISVGGFFGSLTGGSTSKLTLSGSGSVTLPDIVSGQLNTLIVNRTANDKITLGGNLQITNILDIESGNINTGIKSLTLGTSGANVGTLTYNAGASTGIITGKFIRWFGTSVNAQPVKFPVGDVTAYSSPRMVTIKYTTAPTTAGTLTTEYITGDPGKLNTTPILDGAYIVDTYSKVGYWQITPTTLTGGTYTITISPSGFIGMNVFAQLRVLKRPVAGNDWTLSGIHVNGDGIPTASRSGLTGFSQFALGGNTIDNPLDGPLPVELTSFTSIITGRDIKLNWTTATETNNSGFEIERSNVKGQTPNDWAKIGFINGNGTKGTPTNYSFDDKKLNTGKYNYRLKQIDYNGNFEYFNLNNEVVIGTPDKFDVSQNYPNPFNPTTKIDYQIPENGKVKLVIYDMLGREMKNLVNETKQGGYYTAEFNANNFASGIYIYRLSFEGVNNKFLITKKMSLIK